MKAFERMEKAQQRRQESIAKTTHRKDPRDDKDDVGDEAETPPSQASGNNATMEKRVIMVQEARTKTFWRG